MEVKYIECVNADDSAGFLRKGLIYTLKEKWHGYYVLNEDDKERCWDPSRFVVLDNNNTRDINVTEPSPVSGSAYGSKGTKHNQGKPALSIFPRSAALEAAKTFMDGRDKYTLHNYKQGLSAHEMADALLRHLYAWLDGEELVPDSKHGAHHLGAVIANAAMILECQQLGTLNDDRFKRETKK